MGIIKSDYETFLAEIKERIRQRTDKALLGYWKNDS
jgi:hypothetical protein